MRPRCEATTRAVPAVCEFMVLAVRALGRMGLRVVTATAKGVRSGPLRRMGLIVNRRERPCAPAGETSARAGNPRLRIII